MGQRLTGTSARIWGLHVQGFAPSRIAELVGLAEDHVRNVITGVWLDDKLSARNKAA